MSEKKEFPTLVLASTVTGIGLCNGLTYSKMQECAEWLCGHPVWTHELAYEPTIQKWRDEGYRQFPNLPSVEQAEKDWQHAAAIAVKHYGETVSVEHGHGERIQSPIATIMEMRPDATIIPVVTGEP